MQQMKPIKYFKSFNSIRFFAFLLVFLQHALGRLEHQVSNETVVSFLKPLIYTGGHGVSLFFVLSGFLITYIILREEHQTKTINLKNFYVRRTLRIWPLFFLIFLLGFFLYPLIMSISGDVYIPCQSPWLNAFFLNNFDAIRMLSFKDSLSCESYNPQISVTWSVGIEEQFYLFWPLIFLFFKKPIIRLGFLIIFLGISTLFIYSHANEPNVVYFHTISASTYLIVGGLGAMLIFYKPKAIAFFKGIHPFVVYLIYSLIFIFLFVPSFFPFNFSFFTKIVTAICFLFLYVHRLLIVRYLCLKGLKKFHI